jgi:hypothetical protein
MIIRKEIDNTCSLAIEGLDLSCSTFVCNSIIENTNSSISSSIVTPPLLDSIKNEDSPASSNEDDRHKAECALLPLVLDYNTISSLIVPDISNDVIHHQDSVSSALTVPYNQAYSDSASSRPLLIPRSKIHLISNLTGKGGANIKTASGHIITSTDSGKFVIGKENIPVDIMEDSDLMHSILGLGPLANLDYTIILNKNGMVVSKDGIELIKSYKSPTAVLWPMNLDQPLECQHLNTFNGIEGTLVNLSISHTGHADFAKFVSSAMGSPADSTLIKALRKGYIVWPHFTASMLAGNPTNLMATHKGHLDAIPSWIQSSTKKVRNAKRRESRKRAQLLGEVLKLVQGNRDIIKVEDDQVKDTNLIKDHTYLIQEPLSPSSLLSQNITMSPTFKEDWQDNIEEDCIYTQVSPYADISEELKSKIIAHSDATGRYPVQSLSRNNYVLITVYRNYIKYTPFQTRSALDYVKAFDSMISFFSLHGKAFKIIRMDNETSTLLETYFKTRDITPEYVATGDHRTLLAERAIRTAKNHLIAIMAGADEDCPQYLWDEAASYAEITLNLLRPYYGNDSISAYQGIVGYSYDMAKNPLCVYGTKALAFNSPDERGTWSDHGTPVFYLGPSLRHYRSHRVYDIKTRHISRNNNLAFYHRKLLMPGSSLGDRLAASIKDIATVLHQIGQGTLLKDDDRPNFKDKSSSLVDALKHLSGMFVSPPLRTHDLPTEPSVALQRVVASQPPQAIADQSVQLQRVEAPQPTQAIQEEPLQIQRVVAVAQRPSLPDNIDDQFQMVHAPVEVSARLTNLRTMKRKANLQKQNYVNMLRATRRSTSGDSQVPLRGDNNVGIADVSLLDAPIQGNHTGGGITKVLTGPSTITGAEKGLFYSQRISLPSNKLICLYEHEPIRYATREMANAIGSNRVMEGPPEEDASGGRYFVGKANSYGTYANDPLDALKYNADLVWNAATSRWEVRSTIQIDYLDEIFVRYGPTFWEHMSHVLHDKELLFALYPELRARIEAQEAEYATDDSEDSDEASSEVPTRFHPNFDDTKPNIRLMSKRPEDDMSLSATEIDTIISSATIHIDGEIMESPHHILMAALHTLSADNLPGNYSKKPSEDFLNLDHNGNPLTYNTALADPDRHDDFVAAGVDEWDKFIRRRACMQGIHYKDIPEDRRGDITYLSHQVKEKINAFKDAYEAKVRICVGGDKTHYTGDKSAHVAAMASVKILLNDVVSSPGAKFATIDIVDFYLMTPLDRLEYVKIAASKVPAQTIAEFNLDQYIDSKGFIYFVCTRTVWGLPQAGLISNKALVKVLHTAGYIQSSNSYGLFKHVDRGTTFSLVVDDFGIKYYNMNDFDHLADTLKTGGYDVKINMKGDKYLGFTIKHDLIKKEIVLSMPKYVPKGLNRFCPDGPPKFAGSAILYTPPKYGTTGEKFAFVDDSAPVHLYPRTVTCDTH